MAEKYGVELYEGMCVEAFIRGYVDWNPLVLGDGMSIRFDATNVRIYFYDESSYDRVDGLHVNVNHEELPVFEYAGMPHEFENRNEINVGLDAWGMSPVSEVELVRMFREG